MNSISISGNLGKDCEIRNLPDGTSVAAFSVADSQGKDKPTIWWNASLFGKRADSLAQYLTKGQQVTVIGTVSEREWSDKEGNKRKSMDIRVQDVALMGGKREASEPRSQNQELSIKSTPSPHQLPRQLSSGFEGMDDDVPF